MGGLRYFQKLTALTLARLCRQSGLLAGLAVLCAVLPLLAGAAAEAVLSGGVSFSGVILAVTAPEGDELPRRLARYIGGMDDVSQYCRVEAMDRDSALSALAEGRVTAVLELPDEFVRRVQTGENPAVGVIVDGSRPLESLLTLWAGQSAADLLAAAQAGICEVLDLYDASPPPGLTRDRVVMDINLKYIRWTLDRQAIFDTRRLLPTDTLPIALHYRLSLLGYLVLSAAPLFAWIWQEPWLSGLRRLRYAGRSPAWAFFAGLTACWGLAAAVLFAGLRLLAELPAAGALAAAVTGALFFAAYAAACALLTGSAAGCGGLSFFLSLGALALCGGIVPPVLLPEAVRQLAVLSPITWLRALAARPLGYETAAHPAPALLAGAAVLSGLSAWLYVRRAEGGGTAP